MFPNSTTRGESTTLLSGTEAKRPCLAPSFGLLPKLSTENKFLQGTSLSSSTSLISQRRSQLISSLTTQKLVNPLLAKNGPDATTKNTTSSQNLQSKIPFNSISTKPNLTLSSERYEICSVGTLQK